MCPPGHRECAPETWQEFVDLFGSAYGRGLAEHRATVAAMRSGNGEEAERLRRANLQGAKEYLRGFGKYVL